MAKDLSRLMNAREHMVINPNTSGNSEHVSDFMKLSGWTGENFVQLKDGDASLWTLAQDNETAIEFISKNQTVERLDQISGDVTTLSAETILFSAATIENERVISEALNDLNDRLNKIATPQDILTSEDYGEGFADAFDVKNFSVYDVDTTDSATTSGVRTVVVDGLKKMDFSRLSIDCGTY